MKRLLCVLMLCASIVSVVQAGWLTSWVIDQFMRYNIRYSTPMVDSNGNTYIQANFTTKYKNTFCVLVYPDTDCIFFSQRTTSYSLFVENAVYAAACFGADDMVRLAVAALGSSGQYADDGILYAYFDYYDYTYYTNFLSGSGWINLLIRP